MNCEQETRRNLAAAITRSRDDRDRTRIVPVCEEVVSQDVDRKEVDVGTSGIGPIPTGMADSLVY